MLLLIYAFIYHIPDGPLESRWWPAFSHCDYVAQRFAVLQELQPISVLVAKHEFCQLFPKTTLFHIYWY